MTIVIGELHTQIESTQHHLTIASQEGLPYEAYLHRVRLEELMGMAERHGVDVSTWVDRSLLPPLALTEG